jgi:hypothetical protein
MTASQIRAAVHLDRGRTVIDRCADDWDRLCPDGVRHDGHGRDRPEFGSACAEPTRLPRRIVCGEGRPLAHQLISTPAVPNHRAIDAPVWEHAAHAIVKPFRYQRLASSRSRRICYGCRRSDRRRSPAPAVVIGALTGMMRMTVARSIRRPECEMRQTSAAVSNRRTHARCSVRVAEHGIDPSAKPRGLRTGWPGFRQITGAQRQDADQMRSAVERPSHHAGRKVHRVAHAHN